MMGTGGGGGGSTGAGSGAGAGGGGGGATGAGGVGSVQHGGAMISATALEGVVKPVRKATEAPKASVANTPKIPIAIGFEKILVVESLFI